MSARQPHTARRAARRRPLVLARCALALVAALLLAAGSEPAAPDWESETPICVNGAFIGMPRADLEAALGSPESQPEPDLAVYDRGRMLARVKDDQVVYVSGDCLGQGARTFPLIGCRAEFASERLGRARSTLTRESFEVRIYSARTADLGVMVREQRVAGFLLTPPQTMENVLRTAGYR